MMARLATALLLTCLLAPAQAHKPSDSYLTLHAEGGRLEGRWDIALRDLDFALGLDADGDSQLIWDEVRSRHADIAAYALSRLTLGTADGAACPLVVTGQMIERHSDGAYAVLLLRAPCAAARGMRVGYRLFADIDAQHRGLISVNGQSAVLGGDRTGFVASPQADALRQGMEYLRHGVWHIWTGYDHVLFLLSLLLPAVLAARWPLAAADVVRVVTAFTLAHSVTLSLAALQMVSLPSRWVESAIALSVAVAAVNNIWPLFRGRRWLAAFAFGLLHGFGFAGVLAGLGLPQGATVLALASFNAGVEVGQLALVAIFLPLAWLARSSWLYRALLVKGGSACIALLACAWLVQRAA